MGTGRRRTCGFVAVATKRRRSVAGRDAEGWDGRAVMRDHQKRKERLDSGDDEADRAGEEAGEDVVGHDADAFGLGVLNGVDHAGFPDVE